MCSKEKGGVEARSFVEPKVTDTRLHVDVRSRVLREWCNTTSSGRVDGERDEDTRSAR